MAVVAGFISTEEGRAALRVAITEAQLRKTNLVVVVHAAQGSGIDRESALVQAKEICTSAGIDVEFLPTFGEEFSQEILQVSERVGAALIVIGLRRRSITGKLILGSSAQRILLDSATPVMAVKSAR